MTSIKSVLARKRDLSKPMKVKSKRRPGIVAEPYVGETLADRLAAAEYRRSQGNWIPAGGGTEVPFTSRSGRRLQYVWQPSTGKHAYLDMGADMILSDDDAWLALGKY